MWRRAPPSAVPFRPRADEAEPAASDGATKAKSPAPLVRRPAEPPPPDRHARAAARADIDRCRRRWGRRRGAGRRSFGRRRRRRGRRCRRRRRRWGRRFRHHRRWVARCDRRRRPFSGGSHVRATRIHRRRRSVRRRGRRRNARRRSQGQGPGQAPGAGRGSQAGQGRPGRQPRPATRQGTPGVERAGHPSCAPRPAGQLAPDAGRHQRRHPAGDDPRPRRADARASHHLGQGTAADEGHRRPTHPTRPIPPTPPRLRARRWSIPGRHDPTNPSRPPRPAGPG